MLDVQAKRSIRVGWVGHSDRAKTVCERLLHLSIGRTVLDPEAVDVVEIDAAASAVDCLVIDGAAPATDLLPRPAVQVHLEQGRPLLGFGFQTPRFPACPDFDRDILGVRFHATEPGGERQLVRILGESRDHPVASGIEPFWAPSPTCVGEALDKESIPILWGACGRRADPVAWLRTVGDARIFHTSLRPDQRSESMIARLIANALCWGLKLL